MNGNEYRLSWFVVFRRELADYFYTPIAYIFLIIFLTLSSVLTFHVGEFFQIGQADLTGFFSFLPWLFLVLAPALGMRLWAEERKTGTIQTLLTLPISVFSAVLGKFLAAWLFMAFALFLTMPIWLTVNYLGHPDNGAIIAGYIGGWLMAGAYLSISCFTSALSQNQVVAFVLGIAVGLFFTIGEVGLIQDAVAPFLSHLVLETMAGLSILGHFEQMAKGILSLSNIMFFVSVLAMFIYFNVVAVSAKKKHSLN